MVHNSLRNFQNFVLTTEPLYPAINANGYYSISNGCFLTIDEAEGEEAQMLLKYWQIEYNGIFDAENRSEVFFPLDE